MQVAWAARACAHGELACQLSFGRCCERRSLLVAHVDPVDAALLRAAGFAHGVDDGVERIAYNAVDPVYPCIDKLVHDLFRYVHAISLK